MDIYSYTILSLLFYIGGSQLRLVVKFRSFNSGQIFCFVFFAFPDFYLDFSLIFVLLQHQPCLTFFLSFPFKSFLLFAFTPPLSFFPSNILFMVKNCLFFELTF